MGYVWFDYDVCGEWKKKWKMYGDVNKKVKEKEGVYKRKRKKCLNTKLKLTLCYERKRSSWKEDKWNKTLGFNIK